MKRFLIEYDAFRGVERFSFSVGIVAESKESAIKVIGKDAERVGATYEIKSIKEIDSYDE